MNDSIRGINIGPFREPDYGVETWDCGPDEVDKEKSLVSQRINDNYPQGRDKVYRLLDWCRNHRRGFRILARKTIPFWTWFYDVI